MLPRAAAWPQPPACTVAPSTCLPQTPAPQSNLGRPPRSFSDRVAFSYLKNKEGRVARGQSPHHAPFFRSSPAFRYGLLVTWGSSQVPLTLPPHRGSLSSLLLSPPPQPWPSLSLAVPLLTVVGVTCAWPSWDGDRGKRRHFLGTCYCQVPDSQTLLNPHHTSTVGMIIPI